MRTRAATLAVLSLLAAGLPALQPSYAAVPAGKVEIAVVASNDGLQTFSPPSGVRTASGGEFDSSPALSRDGSTLVTVETRMSVAYTVVVRSLDGGYPRGSFTNLVDAIQYATALSPNGSRVAFVDRAGQDGKYLLVKDMSTGQGQGLPVPLGDIENEFLTQDLLLVRDGGRYRAFGLFGAANRSVVGLTGTATSVLSDFALDPTGKRMVYVRTRGASTAVEVVSVGVTAKQVVFGAPRVLVSGNVGSPAFRLDGKTVVLTRGVRPERDLVFVPATGGALSRFGPATPGVDESFIAFGLRTIPPPPPSLELQVGKPVLNGSGMSVVVRSQVPVRVTRTTEGAEPYQFNRASENSIVSDYGLELGRKYTYAFQGYTFDGRVGPVSTLDLVATAPPALSTADPISLTSTVSSFPVGIATAGNAPDTRYTVDSRVQGRDTWERLVT